MATIKNIFSGDYTAAGGRYREYENQVVSKSALLKIYNLKDRGYQFVEMGKGFVVMTNNKTRKTVTVYFPY